MTIAPTKEPEKPEAKDVDLQKLAEEEMEGYEGYIAPY